MAYPGLNRFTNSLRASRQFAPCFFLLSPCGQAPNLVQPEDLLHAPALAARPLVDIDQIRQSFCVSLYRDFGQRPPQLVDLTSRARAPGTQAMAALLRSLLEAVLMRATRRTAAPCPPPTRSLPLRRPF